MPRYGLLAVEGPHDAEFVCRLLKPWQFNRVQNESHLDPALVPLVPRKYPPEGDLLRRMETPLFLTGLDLNLAIVIANGDSKLVAALCDRLNVLGVASVSGAGILLDADRQKTASAADRYAGIRAGMALKGILLAEQPGRVTDGPPRRGAFVLPDNANPGTLEDLLLEAGQFAYPSLLASAHRHVADALANTTSLTAADRDHLSKPSGVPKAVMAAATAVLRPGKAIQVSIQDNRWLNDPATSLPRVRAVQQFLADLFGLPFPPGTTSALPPSATATTADPSAGGR